MFILLNGSGMVISWLEKKIARTNQIKLHIILHVCCSTTRRFLSSRDLFLILMLFTPV